MEQGDPGVIQSQPVSFNDVRVRNMTESDSDFAGALMVKAFESKFIHAVGKENLDNATVMMAEMFRAGNFNYERVFIAEVDGRQAGMMEIKLPGDRQVDNETERMSRAWNSMGCCAKCGLYCLLSLLEEKNIKAGKLYLAVIAVADGFRGKGVGKVLMGVADQQAQAHNCKSAYLWVSTDNRANHLYQREGYVVEERHNSCIIKCMAGKSGFAKMVKRYGPRF